MGGCLATVLLWIFSIVVALLVAVAVDLALLPRSRFHTWRSLALMYLVRRYCQLVGWYNWRQVSAKYSDLRGAQERFVLKVVKTHADSDYGRHHSFADIRSLEDFRRLHPVTDYSHYKSYIERAMQGDVRALFGPGQELAMFYCSSGTTGVSKYIPMTRTGFKEQYLKVVGCMYGFIGKYYFPWNLYKVATFPCAPRWRYTSTGVKIGPSSAHRLTSKVLSSQYTMPVEANIIRKEAEAMHVAFVLALRDRDVYFWEAGFSFSLWNQLQFLERNWPVIVNDIRCGRLSPALDITEEQRKAIDSLLSPDSERAAELQKEFERCFDGIVPRVFPNVQMVMALSSGTSMAVYSERCKKYLGHLRIASAVYGASEGAIGVNVKEPGKQPEYALVPEADFVEFLPVDESGEAEEGATPLLASEVKMDQLYEVVLTNATGLYRYRMGDVVRVVGSYHGTPTVDFQFRAKQMLNVHMEKVSEAAFTGALRRAVDGWPDHQLVDFTTAESVLDPAAAGGRSADSAGSPPYYLVLLELSGPSLPSQRIDDIDATLQQEHFVYRSFRVKSSIGPMRVVRVQPGTFAAYRQHVFDTTQTTINQFKQPRVLRTEEQVKFFLDREL
ncbi:GH3 domain-containing protein-like isoform X1 [Amphibalanus amphitrite]|uniref:GH3 domain-containing protein-like isoform X1 n=1 Tax=Amphibalanus amphitrite TaxID=1232801 RepID=UPI001C91193F|nr:GH3 domain-containing protein-like isoform X1 [Amphibalanus amphitrite]